MLPACRRELQRLLQIRHPGRAPPVAGTKLLAEAWDAAGLYQVGSFVGDAWQEWNGRFRDDVRSFLRGEAGAGSRLPRPLPRRPPIYGPKESQTAHHAKFLTGHHRVPL